MLRAALPALAGGLLLLTAAAQTPTHFDAATIRPEKPANGPGISTETHADPQRFTARNLSLQELLQQAYSLQAYQVVGPPWLGTKRFDVSAEVSAPMNYSAMKVLLQPLLQERFQMKTHWETRRLPGYALVVAPGGAKVGPPPADGVQPLAIQGRQAHSRLRPGGSMTMGHGGVEHTAANFTSSQLAQVLSRQLGVAVQDLTHLQGPLAIQLTYMSPRLAQRPHPLGAQPGADAAAAAPAPTLFEAVERQLGLKLERHTLAQRVLVVDSAQPVPIAN